MEFLLIQLECNRGDERDHNDGQWAARSAGNSIVLYGTEACRAGLQTPGSNSDLNSHAYHACLRLRLSPAMFPVNPDTRGARIERVPQCLLHQACFTMPTAPWRRHSVWAPCQSVT